MNKCTLHSLYDVIRPFKILVLVSEKIITRRFGDYVVKVNTET